MLHLYYYEDYQDDYIQVSESGVMTEPAIFTHNPDESSTKTMKVFLRNTDPTKYYEDVTVSFKPDSLVEVGNSLGWSWKLLQQDTEPQTADWETATESVTLGDIGSSTAANTNYIPIWIQGTFVSGMPTGNYDDVYLNTYYSAEGNVTGA